MKGKLMKLHEYQEMVKAEREALRLANLAKMSVLTDTITKTQQTKKEGSN